MSVTFLTNEDKALIDQQIGELSEEMAGKPRVYIDGVIPTTKDDVLAELTYEHGTERWHAYIEIKCQGSSSMSYPKKNFTVKLYEDEARTIKMNRKMFGWPVTSNKFVLKANYIDHTHARNIVNARLWGEVVASRPDYDTLPEELRNSPNNGAIDGYPIIVYTNGTYQGLYTWNIGKDPWMVGMDEDNPDHVFLCNEQNTNATDSPSNFRVLWDGSETYWKVEVGKGGAAVTAAFNNLVNCALNMDDAAFRENIPQYLDVQSAIDYYLHQYVICGLDGLGKNMPLIKYSPLQWRLTAYDMDATWLLWWTGGSFVSADYACPKQYQESRNLLFERIASVYFGEMVARYTALRKTVYSYANIMSHFERFCYQIGKETYADDLVPYPDIPSAETNNIWQLRNAVRDRLAYCDKQIVVPDYADGLAYRLPQPMEFNGISDYIDTGVQLFDTAKDFTIYMDIVLPSVGSGISQETALHCIHEVSPWYGLNLAESSDGLLSFGGRGDGQTYFAGATYIPSGGSAKLCLRAVDGVITTLSISKDGSAVSEYAAVTNEYHQMDETVLLGCYRDATDAKGRYWKGTMNDCRIWERTLTDAEVSALF